MWTKPCRCEHLVWNFPYLQPSVVNANQRLYVSVIREHSKLECLIPGQIILLFYILIAL